MRARLKLSRSPPDFLPSNKGAPQLYPPKKPKANKPASTTTLKGFQVFLVKTAEGFTFMVFQQSKGEQSKFFF